MGYELKSYNRWMDENETPLHDHWIENDIDASFETWTRDQYRMYAESIADANYDSIY